jgi:hypothetical protein
MRKIYAAVKGSMRTTARAPTALAKRWTVRMDGVPPATFRRLCVIGSANGGVGQQFGFMVFQVFHVDGVR